MRQTLGFCTIMSFSASAMSLCILLNACQSHRQKKKAVEPLPTEKKVLEETQRTSEPLAFTFYESKAFGGKCPPPSPDPDIKGGFAPAEGDPITEARCTDNWIPLDNPSEPPDIESGDRQWLSRILGRSSSKKDWIDLGLIHCKDQCVRQVGQVIEINLPTCTTEEAGLYRQRVPAAGSHCNGRVYTLLTDSGEKAKVYIQSICPSRHWKNLIKTRLGLPSCQSKNQIDLEKETLHDQAFLGHLTTADQGKKKVRLLR